MVAIGAMTAVMAGAKMMMAGVMMVAMAGIKMVTLKCLVSKS